MGLQGTFWPRYACRYSSSPWRNSRTPLTDVRGSVDSARYRAATVRERFHHGLLGTLGPITEAWVGRQVLARHHRCDGAEVRSNFVFHDRAEEQVRLRLRQLVFVRQPLNHIRI